MSGWNWNTLYEEVTPGGEEVTPGGPNLRSQPEFKVFDPRGTGGALEGSPRGPQQQNPYDSLKKLFGGNLQRNGGGFGGGLQDLFGRIGQQTGQMQGAPNSQYEGRNPDGSSFRSQFPMGNNPPQMRGNNPPPPPPIAPSAPAPAAEGKQEDELHLHFELTHNELRESQLRHHNAEQHT